MDVVMLGHPDAGKTSYMAAMYGAMSAGVEGFTVRAERNDDHRALTRNASALRSGRFPAPTDRRSVYRLKLLYDQEPVLDFVWRDYRGGVTTEKATESSDVRQLRRDLGTASGLVLVVDSTDLDRGPRSLSRVRPLVSTTMRLLSERETVLPLVIILTKWDLIAGCEGSVLAAANEVFDGLISAVRSTPHVHGSIVPVVCGARPLHVADPVLWCLHVEIAIRGRLLLDRIREADRRAGIARSRNTLWDRVRSSWQGEPTWAEIASDYERSIDEDAAALLPLIAPSERLESALESLMTF